MRPLLIGLVACTPDDPIRLHEPDPPTDTPPDTGTLPVTTPSYFPISAVDLAPELGLQGAFGSLNRGRACLSSDFDGDGDNDVWLGNPSDQSYVRLNLTTGPGHVAFSDPVPAGDGDYWWGGAAGDFNNDGWSDFYTTGGGNEIPWPDGFYFSSVDEKGVYAVNNRAEFIETDYPPSDVVIPGVQLPHMSASAHAFDADNDGWLDVLVNSYVPVARLPADSLDQFMELYGGALLWRNLGAPVVPLTGGGFTPPGNLHLFDEIAFDVGLTPTDPQQNSTSLDWDRDGDLDLVLGGHQGYNHLYRNLLVETGELRFEDVTVELDLAGKDLRYPWNTFATFAEDVNFDGWDDVVLFVRAFEPADSPFQDGHVVLLNVQGTGFVDVAPYTGINEPFVNWEEDTFRDHSGSGVMGSGLADLNADGIGDPFVGQGGPPGGTTDIQFVSTGLVTVDVAGLGPTVLPNWEDISSVVDFPAVENPDLEEVWPPYPYRTHGTCQVDFDRDGLVEQYVNNGGTVTSPVTVQEPVRLWQYTWEDHGRWLSVGLTGDGVVVNRSAIGTRVAVTVERDADDATWTITRTLKGGNGFSAMNGDDLYFGLADADRIVEVEVRWTDGRIDHPPIPAMDAHVELTY